MATTTAPPGAEAEVAADSVTSRFGVRAKMLASFGVALTILFGFFAWFIVDYVAKAAQTRIVSELQSYAEGNARVINTADLSTLLKELPTYDPANPYPTSNPLYAAANQQLKDLQTAIGVGENYSPYTYTMGPDGTLQWLTSWSAVNPTPPFTIQYRAPTAETFPGGESSEAYQLLKAGLSGTVNQPQYTDDNGTWISTYTPIVDANGKVIAGLGADFNINYVNEVRTQAIRNILPLLLIGYLILLGLVFVVSTWLTRPLKRLTVATEQIAGGNYEIDVSNVVRTKIPDEMSKLAHSFGIMVTKVRAREKNLTTQVKKLKVEIDANKRAQAVNEITDSDFFSAIAAKAASQRQRMTEMDRIDADDSPASPAAPADTSNSAS